MNGVLHLGLDSYVPAQAVAAILPVDSAPVRAVIRRAEQEGRVLDATRGRKTRAFVRLINGDIVLSAIEPQTLADRLERDANHRTAGPG